MNFNFANIRALVRVDFNVPIDKKTFQITDDTRMRAALPTINKILNDGGSVVLLSHFDRPLKKLKEDGTVDVKRFTLQNLQSHDQNSSLDNPKYRSQVPSQTLPPVRAYW